MQISHSASEAYNNGRQPIESPNFAFVFYLYAAMFVIVGKFMRKTLANHSVNTHWNAIAIEVFARDKEKEQNVWCITNGPARKKIMCKTHIHFDLRFRIAANAKNTEAINFVFVSKAQTVKKWAFCLYCCCCQFSGAVIAKNMLQPAIYLGSLFLLSNSDMIAYSQIFSPKHLHCRMNDLQKRDEKNDYFVSYR